MSSWDAAEVHNILIALWNEADRPTRSRLHYGMWGWVALAFALAGAALSVTQLHGEIHGRYGGDIGEI